MPTPPSLLVLGSEQDFPRGLAEALASVGVSVEFRTGAAAPRTARPSVALLAGGGDTVPARIAAAAASGAGVVVWGRLPSAVEVVAAVRAGAADFVEPAEGVEGLVRAVARLARRPGGEQAPPAPTFAEPGLAGPVERAPQSTFSVQPSGDFTVSRGSEFTVTPSVDSAGGRAGSTRGPAASLSPSGGEERSPPAAAGPTLERRPASLGRSQAAPPPPPPTRGSLAPGGEAVLAALSGRAGAGILAKAQINTPGRAAGGVIVGAQGTALPSAIKGGGDVGEALPPLDPGLPELQELMARPECPVDDVERFVVKDPALVVAVLKMANTAYFRSPRLVTNIREACVRLGNRQVFALLLESLLRRTFTAPSPDARLVFDAMWRNAALTARVSRRLAEWQRFARPEDVYVAALLHNLGEFVLVWRVVQASGQQLGPAIDLAAAQIARDHERVGQAAAQRWGLPPMVQVLAGSHHQPRRGEPSQDAAMRAAVTACWHLARSVGGEYLPGASPPDPLPLFDEMALPEALRARIAEECVAAMEGL